MNPDATLDQVCRAIEALIDVGDSHDGLFPSLIDRRAGRMLEELPPVIDGQRDGDRSHHGSNLIHDEALLATMYALAEALGQDRYAAAADRYLQRFATHCTDTASGLFPWGEHSFWDLRRDEVGNCFRNRNPERQGAAIHDHLRQAPLWLWAKLHEFNPRCVERFGEGLDYHWSVGEPDEREYLRHAPITDCYHYTLGNRARDFPRHSGFYILDWAFAYQKTGRADFLEQIRLILDYWWRRRDEHGMLLIESRAPEDDLRFHNTNAPAQTLSLAASLYESAPLIEAADPPLAAAMRERAAVYLEGFLAAPHDLEAGSFVLLCPRAGGGRFEAMPVWGSRYGLWPASYVGLTCLGAHRLTGDERLLRWAAAAGREYLRQPFPEDVQAPARDAGQGLGLVADLYDVTGDQSWLDGAAALANALTAIYLDEDLPRGAAGIDHYESQMGPSFLLHGLARTALLARSPDSCPLAADYTGR